MLRRFSPITCAIGSAFFATAIAGHASAAAPEVEKARAVFNVGAQAFEKGDFAVALEAFEAAYKLAPRPGLLFSIAQAHRRQYHVTHRDVHLREAVRIYREYLDKVKEGERRADAAQALVELEPLAARLAPLEGSPEEQRPAASRTRLMVSSEAERATVTLDGAESRGSPLILDVKSGAHKVRVEAPGYVPEERDVVAVEGGLVAIDVPLRERPARLAIHGPPDTDISVDRRLAGRTPLAAPLEVTAGAHTLWLSRAGYEPRRIPVNVARGEEKTVSFDLRANGQRVLSQVFLLGAGATLLAGGVFATVAVLRDQDAQDILNEAERRNLSPGRVEDYESARDSRDTFRTLSAVSFGASLGLLVTSGALYLFDKPVPAPFDAGGERPPSAPEKKRDGKAIDLALVPTWAPGQLGFSAGGRF